MPNKPTRSWSLTLAFAVWLLTSCGADNQADVGIPAPPGSAAPSGRQCEPIGTDLAGAADTVVAVALVDHAIVLDRSSVPAGVLTFATRNEGTEAHELAFLPGGGELPLLADGSPDEAALEDAGAFELEAYGPGGTCDATYVLPAGTYTLFCIVEAPDGSTHYSHGMRETLVVT